MTILSLEASSKFAVPTFRPVDTENLNSPDLAKRVKEYRAYWNDHHSGRRAHCQTLKTDGHWATVIDTFEGAGQPRSPLRKNLYYLKRSSELVGAERLRVAHYEKFEQQVVVKGLPRATRAIPQNTLERLDTRLRKRRQERFIIRPASLANIDNDEELSRALLQGFVSWLNLWQQGKIHRNVGLPNLVLVPSRPSPSWDPEWDFGSAPLFTLNVPSSARDDKTHKTLKKKIEYTIERDSRKLEDFRARLPGLDEKAMEKRMSVEYWAEEVNMHMQRLNLDGDVGVHGIGMQGRAKVVLEEVHNTVDWEKLSSEWEYMRKSGGQGMSKYLTGHIIRERARVHRGRSSDYVHGPLDDFKAFLYTFSYAVFLRPLRLTKKQTTTRTCSSLEHRWISAVKNTGVGSSSTNSICEGSRSRDDAGEDRRSWLRYQLRGDIEKRTSSSNKFRVNELFWSWFVVSNKVRMDWMVIGHTIGTSAEEDLMFWHLWAYKGVAQMLGAYEDHLRKLNKLDDAKTIIPVQIKKEKDVKDEGTANELEPPAEKGGNAGVVKAELNDIEMKEKDSAHAAEEVVVTSKAADNHEDIEMKDGSGGIVSGEGTSEDKTREGVVENERKDEASAQTDQEKNGTDATLKRQADTLDAVNSKRNEVQTEVDDSDKRRPFEGLCWEDEETVVRQIR